MEHVNNYKNCRIILYDGDIRLAETTILEFDERNYMITVRKSAFPKQMPGRVSVLIFAQKPVEYKGTIRKGSALADKVEIALFQGEEKENRIATRYTVDAPALVENLVIAGKLVPLPKPLEMQMCNVSTEGCLIKGKMVFNVNTTFQLQLTLSEGIVHLYPSVVWSKKIDEDTAEYGCKFHPFH